MALTPRLHGVTAGPSPVEPGMWPQCLPDSSQTQILHGLPPSLYTYTASSVGSQNLGTHQLPSPLQQGFSTIVYINAYVHYCLTIVFINLPRHSVISICFSLHRVILCYEQAVLVTNSHGKHVHKITFVRKQGRYRCIDLNVQFKPIIINPGHVKSFLGGIFLPVN